MTAENEYWPLTLAMWFCAYDSHLSDISARYSARYSQRGDSNLRVKTRNSHGVFKGRPEPVLFEWNPKREVAQYPKTIPILWELNSVMIFTHRIRSLAKYDALCWDQKRKNDRSVRQLTVGGVATDRTYWRLYTVMYCICTKINIYIILQLSISSDIKQPS